MSMTRKDYTAVAEGLIESLRRRYDADSGDALELARAVADALEVYPNFDRDRFVSYVRTGFDAYMLRVDQAIDDLTDDERAGLRRLNDLRWQERA
jgi:hypothetical protein